MTYCLYDTDKSARSSSLVTLLLHLARSLASWSASSAVTPKIVQSSLTLSSQRFFGLPTGLLTCTLPYSMMFGMRFGNIRTTCQKYESRLERTCLVDDIRLIPRSILMSTFLRRSHRLIPAIRPMTAISKTGNFRPISLVIVHVSALYSNIAPALCII